MRDKSLKINLILNIIKTICTMCFPIITFPYISRVIHATNYGKVNFSSSVISYFSLIAALGITSYAIREGAGLRKNKEEFNKFSCQIFTINLFMSLIAYILLIIVYLFWNKLHNYTSLLIVQSIIIIFNTVGVEWIYSIYEDYFYITIRSIVVQIISLLMLFTFVRSEKDYIIYAGITVFANAGANLFNFIHAKKYCDFRLTKNMQLKKHLKPMIILFFSNLTITLYANSDITILGIFCNDFIVGIYGIAVKIYLIIKQLIFAAITVTLPRLSYYKINNEDKYYELLKMLRKTMVYFTVPITVGVIILSKEIVLLLSGTEYLSSYITLSILSIAFIPSTIATIYGNGVLLLNKAENKIFISTLIGAILNVILNIIFIPIFKEKAAALTTVISEIIVAILNISFSRKFIKKDKELSRDMLKSSYACIIILIISLFIKTRKMNTIITISLSVFLSAVSYCLLIIMIEPLFRKMVKQVINKRCFKIE